MWALDGIKAKLEPIEVPEETLKKYVGQYTRGTVTLEDGHLFLNAGPQKFKMIPLSETYFVLDGWTDVRIEFIPDDEGRDFAIKAHLSDGRSEIVNKVKKDK